MDEGIGILVLTGLVIAVVVAIVGYTFSALVWIFGHPMLFAVGAVAIGAIASVLIAERRGGWSMSTTVLPVRFGNLRASLRNWVMGSTVALVLSLIVYGRFAF